MDDSSFFFALCCNGRKYHRVPNEVKIYRKDGARSLKVAQKFSICVGSQLCYVQGLLLNS